MAGTKKYARITDMNDATLRVHSERPDLAKHVCECGEAFERPVWHCLRCGAHGLPEWSACSNCDRKPWRSGITTKEFKD